MLHRRFLLCLCLFSLVFALASGALAEQLNYEGAGENWSWGYGSEEGGGGSSYLGVDIADVSPDRLGDLKLKEEHGAEITMVDQDAPAGKAGLHEHDVIVTLNGTAIDSAAQLRRMIKETPAGRVVNLGISRDGQPLTIKVQLADRHKSMAWEPKINFQMPEIPAIPDFPISVVVVHQSARSGLMVENITPQLGDFFGVKDGNGVLVRAVEKGSSGEKCGFRAGDVVVKVNNQTVHDASDFTHALRSSSGGAVSVTIMRDKREQTLTLSIPEKKDSGSLLHEEESFEFPELTAETEQAIMRAGDRIARLSPAIAERVQEQSKRWADDMEQMLQEHQHELKDRAQEFVQRQKELNERQKELRERQQKLSRQLSPKWAEI